MRQRASKRGESPASEPPQTRVLAGARADDDSVGSDPLVGSRRLISEIFNAAYYCDLFGIELNNKVLTTSTFPQRSSSGIIGLDMLKNFDILFDIHGQKMYYNLISSKQIVSNSISNEIYGNGMFDFLPSNEGLCVNQIIENSPAWIAGFRPGTLITQIDDIKVIDYSYSRLIQIIAGKEDVLFTCIIDGNVKEIRLRSDNLLD